MTTLEKYNQTHLLKYYKELNDNYKTYFDNQIQSIDFELIHNIFSKKDHIIDDSNSSLEPLEPYMITDNEKERLFQIGLDMIRNNETAVVLMAGGQGTRLGHDGPKGTFDIGLPFHKSLFNLQCDKLLRLYDLTNTYIHWYIMTSDDNHTETVSHFDENDYFGYNSDYIHFFRQDRLPLILENGQIAMKSAFELNLAANGNGGVFTSLKSNSILTQMKQHKNKYIFLYGIDNVLAKVADPVFFAFAKEKETAISSKAVNKTTPDEKVGLMCYKNGKPSIVEYSEMSDELKSLRDEHNQLVYRNANILSHVFTFDFLELCAEIELPYHAAHKKVDYYIDGKLNTAVEPNGYKFELFMFDVFQYANDMAVLTVDRDEEFAPVKNKTGNDSPETARNMVYSLHKKWLAKAGKNYDEPICLDFRSTYSGEGL